MRSWGVFLFSLALIVLTSCGDKSSNEISEPSQTAIGHIKVDGDVEKSQRDQMAHAIDYLSTLPALSPTTELAALMAESQLTGSTLLQWLEDRVGYLLPQHFDYQNGVHIMKNSFIYENPTEIPEVEREPEGLRSTSQAEVMMVNSGAAIYLQAKQLKILAGLHLKGVGDISVTSPRVGLIQIGEGLSSMANYAPNHAIDIYILSILFHEARHSDGHGKTTAFIHALCPSGHKYEGLYACDRNLNGPYSIEREVLKELINTCKDCSASQLEYLKYNSADIASRVLVTDKTISWDASPEGHR